MSNNVWDLFSLEGQVALVTGGARNLGRDMVEALAEAGADVAVASRSLERANETAATIAQETGRTVRGYQLDVSEEMQIVRMIGQVIEDFGKLDILVNNAGNPRSSGPPEARSLEEWNYTFAVNSTGVFLCIREAIKHMMPRNSGVIINIASVAGMVGKDRRQYEDADMLGLPVDYMAAKAAVINLTRDYACYLGPYGIRVNSISMAGFERGQPQPFIEKYTYMIPLGRMGEDGKDMKGAVVYLASEASAWVTGHNLVLDGGYCAW